MKHSIFMYAAVGATVVLSTLAHAQQSCTAGRSAFITGQTPFRTGMLKVGDKTLKIHLDGCNFQPFFKSKAAKGPRRDFFCFTDNADLFALRYEWKVSFKFIDGNLFTGKVQESKVPLVVNLLQDPWVAVTNGSQGKFNRYQRKGV